MLTLSAAKIKLTDYSWYKFEGKRKAKFENAHKDYDLEVEPNEKYGIKLGKKYFYLVHQDEPTLEFKLVPKMARNLIGRSVGFSGKIGKVKVKAGIYGSDASKAAAKPNPAPVHSTPFQAVALVENPKLTKQLREVKFPGLKRIKYILTQRPIEEEVYQYYDVTESLIAYRRKHKLKINDYGFFRRDLEDTVEAAIPGLDVEIGYVKHDDQIKQVLVVIED